VNVALNARTASRPLVPTAFRLIVSLASLAVAACHQPPPPAAPPALVVALPVHHDTGGGELVRYPIEVAARYSNTMSFRVAGKLIERSVRLGDSVKQGQVLAQLDPLDAQKQAASARAALEAAEHRLLFARQQLERDKAQGEQNLIATNQLEQTQDTFTAALAGRDQAAAQLIVARNALQYTTLVADHDGVITSENADTGQVVSAGQAVYGLAWIGDTDVILDAAESDLRRISVGQGAKVTFPALPGLQFGAQVREISPSADPQSRTYRVKLTMTDPPESIRLGMTGDAALSPVASPVASANVPASDGRTYTVPATAIFHLGNSPAVWVVEGSDSTLRLRPVKVGSYTDNSSVITAGLHDGDVVVLAGVHTVHTGEVVKPVNPLFDGDGGIEGPALAGAQ
jgi:membrane fusion protein, multidrug efflux system